MSATLGPFELHEPVGRGGMGEVWAGRHVTQGVPVAVKVLTGGLSTDARFLEQFKSEVRAVAGLDHPGIVMVFDHGEIDADAARDTDGRLIAGQPYLVMEMLGGPLSAAANRPRGWPEVRVLLESILDALAHAHARGVIHRDLKLGNMLVGTDPATPYKLVDFGIARAFDAAAPSRPEDASVSGTPSYMAPEQILGELRDQGPWTDLYSLGCVTWRLLTGLAPFGQGEAFDVLSAHLEREVPAFEPRTSVPRGVEGWLRALLVKSHRARTPTAADALEALRSLDESDVFERHGASTEEQNERPTISSNRLPSIESAPPSDEDAPAPCAPAMPASWRRPGSARRSMALIGTGLGLFDLRQLPLVGRTEERDRLWAELATVHRERTPRAVVIRGPAGVGKSRLCEWLAVRARETGAARVLRVTHGPFGGAGHGFAAAVGSFLRVRGLPRSDAFERVRAFLKGAESLHDAFAVTALTADELAPHATPELRLAAARSVLRRAGADRPLIVWLDDVQWGVETLDLLEPLMTEELPVLAVMSAREDALAASPGVAERLDALAGAATTLRLGPLAADERRTLVRELLGMEDELAARVDERTAGHPLFAVQLVGDWVERGILEVGTTGFRLRDGESARLPDDIHESWAMRVEAALDALSGDERISAGHALEVAAALGVEVRTSEWADACVRSGIMGSPRRWVEPLLARRLALGTPDAWSFVHGMLRESIELDAQHGGRWQGRHRACAAMLETRSGRGLHERRARHLVEAGDLDAAIDPLFDAACERGQTADFELAEVLFEERSALLDQFGAAPDDVRRVAGCAERARLAAKRGDVERARELVSRMHELGKNTEGRLAAELDRVDGLVAHKAGDLARSVASYQRALDAFRALDAHTSVAKCLHGLAEAHRARGELEEACDRYRDAIAAHERLGNRRERANGMAGLGITHRRRMRLDQGRALISEALGIFEELGDPLGAAICRNDLGENARLRGDLARAESLYHEAAAAMRAIGSKDALIAELNVGLVRLARRHYERAAPGFESVREAFGAAGLNAFLPFPYAGLLACAAAADDWASWDQHLEQLEPLIASTGVADEDLAWPLERAAALARERGQIERATRAERLATGQREALRPAGT